MTPPAIEYNVSLDDGAFILRYPFSPHINKTLKGACKGSWFDKKRDGWVVSTRFAYFVSSMARSCDWRVSPDAKDLLDLDSQTPTPRSRSAATPPSASQAAPVAQEPAAPEAAPMGEEPAAPAIDTSNLRIPGFSGQLRQDQLEGVAEIVQRRRVLLADLTGMGKTVQCLSAVAAANTYPVIIICQALLRYKWEREARRWFPRASVCVVEGQARRRIRPAQIVIISYDILHHRLGDLLELDPQSIVVDESQFIKEAGPSKHAVDKYLDELMTWEEEGCKGKKPKKPRGSWRTYAAIRLAEKCTGLRILASATPIPNRHKELWPQLQALGLDQHFGGWKGFHVKFCGGYVNKYGWQVDRSLTAPELHRMLKDTCLIRRRMKDLAEAVHEAVELPLSDQKMKEYRQAEEDIIEYMAERAAQLAAQLGQDPNSAAVEAALRAERAKEMVKMSTLRRLAGESKIEAATAWIKDFLAQAEVDENEDGSTVVRKIVVFAYHREVQEALANNLDALWIRSAQDMAAGEITDIVSKFNDDPSYRVLVSTQGAKVGHDLTGAHHMAIIEPPWTWDDVIQMLGRIYGRSNDPHGAFLYHLLGADTIDERIYALLSKKKAQSVGALDGIFDTEDAAGLSDRSVVGDLMIEYAREGRKAKKAA